MNIRTFEYSLDELIFEYEIKIEKFGYFFFSKVVSQEFIAKYRSYLLFSCSLYWSIHYVFNRLNLFILCSVFLEGSNLRDIIMETWSTGCFSFGWALSGINCLVNYLFEKKTILLENLLINCVYIYMYQVWIVVPVIGMVLFHYRPIVWSMSYATGWSFPVQIFFDKCKKKKK